MTMKEETSEKLFSLFHLRLLKPGILIRIFINLKAVICLPVVRELGEKIDIEIRREMARRSQCSRKHVSDAFNFISYQNFVSMSVYSVRDKMLHISHLNRYTSSFYACAGPQRVFVLLAVLIL